MRQSGYMVTIKVFVPAPKDDFRAQAAAASMVQKMVDDQELPDDLAEKASVVSIDGKYSSREISD